MHKVGGFRIVQAQNEGDQSPANQGCCSVLSELKNAPCRMICYSYNVFTPTAIPLGYARGKEVVCFHFK